MSGSVGVGEVTRFPFSCFLNLSFATDDVDLSKLSVVFSNF